MTGGGTATSNLRWSSFVLPLIALTRHHPQSPSLRKAGRLREARLAGRSDEVEGECGDWILWLRGEEADQLCVRWVRAGSEASIAELGCRVAAAVADHVYEYMLGNRISPIRFPK